MARLRGAANDVYRDARVVQRVQDAQVGQSAGAATGQDQPDRPPRHPPRQAPHVLRSQTRRMITSRPMQCTRSGRCLRRLKPCEQVAYATDIKALA